MAEVRRFPSEKSNDLELPAEVRLKLAEFLLDNKTGNVVLNIVNGEIRSIHAEEIIRIKG